MNWRLILSSAPFIILPSMLSGSFIALVRASAVRTKAMGDSAGIPGVRGTPLAMLNGKLLPQLLLFMYLMGLASVFVSVFAYLRKFSPNFSLSRRPGSSAKSKRAYSRSGPSSSWFIAQQLKRLCALHSTQASKLTKQEYIDARSIRIRSQGEARCLREAIWDSISRCGHSKR